MAKFREHSLYFFLLCLYSYIFIVVLSRENAWMNPEAQQIKSHLVLNDTGNLFKDLRQTFNYWEFEWAPRISRPLSSLFEIIDTKFRRFLWKYFVPHPSLSLTFLFSLGLSPLLLYLLLRNFEVERELSLIGVLLYLASPACLSLVAMLFRPAKAMTNFSILLCLYLASRLTQQEKIDDKKYFAFLSILFISFFWDETALLLLPILPVLFPSLLNDKRRAFFYVSLVPLLLLSYFVALPALIKFAGFGHPTLLQYDRVQHFELSPRLFFSNVGGVLKESFGIFSPELASSEWLALLFLLNLGTVACSCWLFVRKVRRGPPVRAAMTVLLVLVIHGIFMCAIRSAGWGAYWYGAYVPIFGILFFMLCWKQVRKNNWAYVCSLVMVVTLSTSFYFTNRAYKRLHFYPCYPKYLPYLFTNEINRFSVKPLLSEELNYLTEIYWRKKRESPAKLDILLPKELAYLPIELRVPGFTYSTIDVQLRREEQFRVIP